MEKSKYQTIIIHNKYNTYRLDKFLSGTFKNTNNILIQKAIRNKDILVNNKVPKKYNEMLYEGDELKLSNFIIKIFNNIPKVVNNKSNLKFTDKEIEKIKNCVIYKDDNIIAINKPAGLAVQSGTKIEKSVNDYLQFLKFEKENSVNLVHRLDKDTSGVLLLARNKEACDILTDYFKEKGEKLEKIYLTLAVGKFTKNTGTINCPLIKKVENGVEKVYRDEKEGKEATTIYKVLDYNQKFDISLVEVKILTGRTHQIRVHLKEIGHPILGDGKYGGKKAFVDGLSDKMHLHSYKINIKDFKGKNINIKAELPEFFQETMKKARFNIHLKNKL
ncbi:MAG TPA: RluA family pseudouridine synthase [Rickettsiales bacterium]|nr:RluA family pseudouridine synthase [Rickettsiales bacterium]